MPSPALCGVFRSLDIYYRDKPRRAALAALAARFIRPGDLAFDIGSHVGDRISTLVDLGARVVAVEPQPLAFRALRLLYGRLAQVELVQAVCADKEGALELLVNSRNPTVSTASRDFVRAADGAPGWHDQVWDERLEVRAVTLDSLIARHGVPSFIKIDVEGFEPDVLAGLSTPVPVLSFEFTLIQMDLAGKCLARLQELGLDRFNYALGESHALVFEENVSAETLLAQLANLPPEANSGDIYAWNSQGR